MEAKCQAGRAGFFLSWPRNGAGFFNHKYSWFLDLSCNHLSRPFPDLAGSARFFPPRDRGAVDSGWALPLLGLTLPCRSFYRFSGHHEMGPWCNWGRMLAGDVTARIFFLDAAEAIEAREKANQVVNSFENNKRKRLAALQNRRGP